MTDGLAARNAALIREYFELIAGGTGSSRPLESYFAEDIVWHGPASNPLVTPNPRFGKEAVMELLGSAVGIYQQGSIVVELQSLVADDERVAAQFELTARLADGTPYRNDYMLLFHLRDGLISAVREYLDTYHQYRLGMFGDRH